MKTGIFCAPLIQTIINKVWFKNKEDDSIVHPQIFRERLASNGYHCITSPIYRTCSYMGHLVTLNSLVTPKHTRDIFHMLFFSTSESTSSYLSLLPSPNHTVLSFRPMDTLLTLAHYIPTCLFPCLHKIQVKNGNILPFSAVGIFYF